MVIELGDQHMRQQARSGHAARNRAAWRRGLHHPLAAAAGLLHPCDLDDLHLRGDHVEKLAHVLADHAKVTAAIRTAGAGVEFPSLPRGLVGDPGPAAGLHLSGSGIGGGRFGIRFASRFIALFGDGYQQVFQRQLELGDLPFDLLRGLAESLFLQPGDPQAQRLDQLFVGLKRGRHARILRLKRDDHRLQNGGVIGENVGVFGHADKYHAVSSKANKTKGIRGVNHPTRAGGAPQSGRRQSIPSQSMASCAEVSRAMPPSVLGQGKRPRSSTL